MNSELFAAIWRASAKDHGLSREELSKVAIDIAAEYAHTSKMGLRAEGHFLYGVSQIWQAKAQQLRADSEHTEEGLSEAFREYLASINNQQDSRLDIGDFSIDNLEIPQSLLSNSTNSSLIQHSHADLSIDDVMRDANEPMDLEPDLVVRSAEEREELEQIDFDLGDSLSQGPAELDFGPDLDYSSSPPHTPQGDQEDVGVQIGGSSPQQIKPVKRKRGAAFDEITTISKPTKASSSILRPEPRAVESFESGDSCDSNFFIPNYSAYIATDKMTENFLDPEFVYSEMKRRRHPELTQSQLETVNDESFENLHGSKVMVYDQEDQFEMDDDMNDIDVDFDFESVEVQDTPELLELEQRNAFDLIKSTLKNKFDHVNFDDLSTEPKTRACLLMEVLTQASKGKLRATQDEPFGPIHLVKVK